MMFVMFVELHGTRCEVQMLLQVKVEAVALAQQKYTRFAETQMDRGRND